MAFSARIDTILNSTELNTCDLEKGPGTQQITSHLHVGGGEGEGETETVRETGTDKHTEKSRQ